MRFVTDKVVLEHVVNVTIHHIITPSVSDRFVSDPALVWSRNRDTRSEMSVVPFVSPISNSRVTVFKTTLI
jgi:hypothetical protein